MHPTNSALLRALLAGSLVVALTSCISIPEDELARLEAIEQDWRSAPAVQADRPYTLLELQEIAIRRQPGLTAIFYRYKAALQRIILAGALSDPMVRYGYFIESVETRVGPQNWKAGISQTFPFWGKRDLRAEVALHEAHELRESLIEQRLAIARDVAKAYWNLFHLDRSRAVITRQIELLEQLGGSIETRITAGRASRSDLLAIQMELDRRQTELVNLGRRERTAMSRVNALLDRDPHEPCRLAFPDPATVVLPDIDADLLIERAKDFGPVRIRTHRILRQEAAVALAELGYYPDFTIGYDYISTGRADVTPMGPVKDSGKDPEILGIGFNLPIWWNKNRARVEQAKDLVDAERASRRQLIREAENNVARHLEAALEAEENRLLFEDRLIPQVEDLLRLSEQEYVTGRVDLDRLIVVERSMLDFDLKRARAVADREIALAELEYLTAGGLGRMPAARPAGAEDIPEVDAMNDVEASKEEGGIAP